MPPSSTIKFIFLSLVFFTIGKNGYLQVDSAGSYDFFMEQGDKLKNISAIKSLDHYFQALKIAEDQDKQGKAGFAYGAIGKVYQRQSLYAEALDNYFKAIRYIKESKEKGRELNIGWLYVDVGNIYYERENSVKAREYYRKSEKIFKKNDYHYGLATIKNNLGLLYYNKEKNDSALYFFREGLEIRKKDTSDALGLSYEYMGEVFERQDRQRAVECYRKALESHKKRNNIRGLGRTYNRMADLMIKSGGVDSAIVLEHKAVRKYREIGDSLSVAELFLDLGSFQEKNGNREKAADNYQVSLQLTVASGLLAQQKRVWKSLYKLELKKENYEKALKYYQNYVSIKDSISNVDMAREMNRLELRFHSRERKSRQKLQEQKSRINAIYHWGAGTGGVLFILVLIFIVNRQRKIIKAKQEVIEKNKTISEKEKALSEAREKENEHLESELKDKKKELVDFALHIAQRNDFLAELKEHAKELDKSTESELAGKKKQLLMKINQGIQINKDFEEFNMEVEKVHKQFLKKLESHFPELTRNDKRLAAMLRLNLSSKEIAAINNISVKAVEMGRYRLRKKLNLDKGENINDFFQDFE